MKNEILLQKLNNIKDVEGGSNYLLETLIKDIENEIRLEEAPKTTTKSRNSFCQRFAKKIKKEVLRYVKTINGIQHFTDSYFMVALNDEDYLPIDEVPESLNYPALYNLLKQAKDNATETIKFNVKDILNEFKIKDVFKFEVNNTKYCICKEVVVPFLKFLNYTDEEIEFNVSPDSCIKPIVVYKSNGSLGLFLPIRDVE